jgi:hypothetical protein
MGTMHWADPNEGVVNSIASTARFKEIENRIDNIEEQIEIELGVEPPTPEGLFPELFG